MESWRKSLAHVAWISLLVAGVSGLPVAAQQASAGLSQPTVNDAQAKPALSVDQANLNELPDSPGATLAQAQVSAVQQTTPSQSSAVQAGAGQTSAGQISEGQGTPPPQKPVGTAAAEAPSTSGVAASEPAGVAIAPAKQRRVRTIVIRTGAIIGAAVAVGVVVALTAGTSSKPPGAH
jgi:hypothetical protein